MTAAIVHWAPDPVLLRIGGVTLRTYTVLFVIGFAWTYLGMRRMLQREGWPVAELDLMTIPFLAVAFAGARLVSCAVYQPAGCLGEPARLLAFDRGGLASHGGALAIVLLWLWSRRETSPPFAWWLDRLSIVALFGAALVRLGNFANAEGIGLPTGGDWGVVFDRVDGVPRHPAQLYDAAACLGIWAWQSRAWRVHGAGAPAGSYFAQALLLVGAARIAVECVKVPEPGSLALAGLPAGLWLSVPVLLAGAWLARRVGLPGWPARGGTAVRPAAPAGRRA